MTPLLTSEEIRKADQIMIDEYGYPGLLLMETAGRKSAEFILEHYPDKDVYLILAGPGNNGGDGLVIARYLHLARKKVQLCLSHPPTRYKGDAATNWEALKGAGIQFEVWEEFKQPAYDPDTRLLVIDALLGTGIQDEPRGQIADMIISGRSYYGNVHRVAIDLPSGLDADRGLIFPDFEPIKCDHTITFQTPKVCHYVTPASNFCGEVVVADIGIWPQVIDDMAISRLVLDGQLARSWYTEARVDTHKGRQGHALFIGGSKRYAGAIALSAHAALAAGAGLSTVITVDAARPAIYAMGPEVMVHSLPGDELGDEHIADIVAFVNALNPQTVAIGPGLGRKAAGIIRAIGEQCLIGSVILDADALNILAEEPELLKVFQGEVTLTPHPGEFKRLIEDEMGDRLWHARRYAHDHKCYLVLKGAGTILAHFDWTLVNTSGNPGMATAGSGDVLTGVIAGLQAQGFGHMDLFPNAVGVYAHGLAGDLCAAEQGIAGVTASGIIQYVGQALEMIRTGTAPQLLHI